MSTNKNGKVATLLPPSLLQAAPSTERIEAIIGLDVPAYHEDDVRRAHAEQAYGEWLKELPEGFHDRITDEMRDQFVEQKFQSLPVGTGDKAKAEYFAHELPNILSANLFAANMRTLFHQIYAATIGIGADEQVTYEVSKTGRAVTIKLTGPARVAGGGSGKRSRKTDKTPSQVIREGGSLLDHVPTISLEGGVLTKAVATWQRIVMAADSFDRQTCQSFLNGRGWNVTGHCNWTQVAGNRKVQAIAEHLEPARPPVPEDQVVTFQELATIA